MNSPLIFITGPFPPPAHGMAVSTEHLATALGRHFSVRRFDIAARWRTGSKVVDVVIRVLQSISVLIEFAWLIVWTRPIAVITALSAGGARVFDIACITVALVVRRRTLVTHHSYAVFEDGNQLSFLRLVQPLLRRCLHVALCEDMKSQLCRAWGLGVARVIVVSNAALVAEPAARQTRETRSPLPLGVFRVGFIANLCAEKGVWTFLEVVTRLQAAGQNIRATIAGRVDPPNVGFQRELEQRLAEMHNVVWLGAVYGRQRAQFYEGLDLLLFPTVYRHESEPLVILEALAHGVPVITTRRGCIPTALSDGVSVRALPESSFVDAATLEISNDLGRCGTSADRKAQSLKHYRTLRRAGNLQLEALIATIGSSAPRRGG